MAAAGPGKEEQQPPEPPPRKGGEPARARSFAKKHVATAAAYLFLFLPAALLFSLTLGKLVVTGKPKGPRSDQILQMGTVLLKGFIRDRVQCCGDSGRIDATMAELGVSESEACDPKTKQLSQCLRRIGDELDGNTELQRMIEQVQMYPPKEVFFRVAAEMFSDGTFNWGRVVALFYFACKLVLKAICTKLPELIRTIIGWTMEYIQDHVLSWIQAQGGWEGLLSYFGTPTWQTIAVFAAGVLTASLTFWKMS